jgi:hypothetical protein
MSSSGAEQTRRDAALRDRDRELVLVGDVLDAAYRGCGALVVVDGVAGIGKSALLAEAGERAREAGLTVLAARGRDAERDFAFGGCLQLFERVLVEPARRERLLVGAAELSRPLLAATEAGTAGGSPEGPVRGILNASRAFRRTAVHACRFHARPDRITRG